jgi:hypothetical protein
VFTADGLDAALHFAWHKVYLFYIFVTLTTGFVSMAAWGWWKDRQTVSVFPFQSVLKDPEEEFMKV